jgi:CRISPR-associated protein Csd1
MSWIDKLYQTYEGCASQIGRGAGGSLLVPVGYIPNRIQIQITLDDEGRFRRSAVVDVGNAETAIPCTEASGGRSSGLASHPLCDKLEYVAADYVAFGGLGRPAKKEKKTKGNGSANRRDYGEVHHAHVLYRTLLDDWCESPFAHPKVDAVRRYVAKGTVIRDLVNEGTLPVDKKTGKILEKFEGKQADKPKIFGVVQSGASPLESFVRWEVEAPGAFESRLWLDDAVWASWADFQKSLEPTRGLCFVTGADAILATNHPKKIRNLKDQAKLISANDDEGFTFRGRFTDKTGAQAYGISYDVSQKAHNALRWLIGRQGRIDGTQAIVAWSVDGKLQDDPFGDSRSLLFSDEELETIAQMPKDSPAPEGAFLAQDFAYRLKKKIGGYKADLGDRSGISVIALDSATPGRMSVNYYRELISSEFIERIEAWHRECCWFQNFGTNARFVGAPAPKDIAETAYGSRLDDKLLASTVRQLLPCILDASPIPRNLIDCCVRRASNRNGIEHWKWEKALGVACALYRKQHITQRNYQMALELERDSRDYLFGRLLALAEGLEDRALYVAGERRETNAGRLMQRFADNPSSTWRTIETSLVPYVTRLQSRRPGFLHHVRSEIDAVMKLFKTDDFLSSAKLTGEFLLAYHCQRAALRTKPDSDSDVSEEESQTNTEPN